MPKVKIRQNSTSLYSTFPANRRTPKKQIFDATTVPLLALLAGGILILIVVFTTDGKPTDSTTWTQYAPTFVALGAVILRGSLAAILGMALYQNLWLNLATSGGGYSSVQTKDGAHVQMIGKSSGGLSIQTVDSLHLASRLAVGMLHHPVLKPGWILGLLGIALTAAIQPVLQAAISVEQRNEVRLVQAQTYHAQFNGSLDLGEDTMGRGTGPTVVTRRAAMEALIGEQNSLRYTSGNFTGTASFGPVKYADVVSCDISAMPGNISNINGWDVYNFTYRYPDSEFENRRKFKDVSKTELVYDGMEVSSDESSTLEIRAVMFNNTHYLSHVCTIQPVIGSCTTHITAGSGTFGDLICQRESVLDATAEIRKTLSRFGEYGAVPAILSAFTSTFAGKSVMSNRNLLNAGKSFFMNTMPKDHHGKVPVVMPADLVSHMRRVLWMTPLLAKLTPQPALLEALAVPITIQDERPIIVYRFNKILAIATVAVIILVGFASTLYLLLSRNPILGRLMRDSLVHSLTVAGPRGPAINGACIASLENILEKAGDEKLAYGVLVEAGEGVSGHLGFAEPGVLPGANGAAPVQTIGRPVPKRWYGGVGELRQRREG